MEKSNKNKTKIGRNDPCICGSGLKYKKCCLHKYRDARLEELIQRPVAPKKTTSLRQITPVDLRTFKVATEHLNKQQKE